MGIYTGAGRVQASHTLTKASEKTQPMDKFRQCQVPCQVPSAPNPYPLWCMLPCENLFCSPGPPRTPTLKGRGRDGVCGKSTHTLVSTSSMLRLYHPYPLGIPAACMYVCPAIRCTLCSVMSMRVHAKVRSNSCLKPVTTVMTAALLASGTPLLTLMVHAAQGVGSRGVKCWGVPSVPSRCLLMLTRPWDAHSPLWSLSTP